MGNWRTKALLCAMWSLLVVYNMVDVYQTWLLIELGAVEVNPLIDFVIGHIGLWGVAIFKMFWLMLLGYGIVYNEMKGRAENVRGHHQF